MSINYGTKYLLSINHKIDMEKIEQLDVFNVFRKPKENCVEQDISSLILLNKNKTLSGYLDSCERIIDGPNALDYFKDIYEEILPESIDLLKLTYNQKRIISINDYCVNDLYNKYQFFPKELSLSLIENSYIYLLDIEHSNSDTIVEDTFDVLNTALEDDNSVYVILSQNRYSY